VYTSDGNTVLIGRGEQCTIVLLVAGISRQHARIDFRGGHYWITDLGTLNGTFVNGRMLDHPRQLDESDRILICNQEFVVRFGEIDRDELLRRREGSVARPLPTPGSQSSGRIPMPTSSPDAGTEKIELPVAEPKPVARPGSKPPASRPGSHSGNSRPASQPPLPPPLTPPGSGTGPGSGRITNPGSGRLSQTGPGSGRVTTGTGSFPTGTGSFPTGSGRVRTQPPATGSGSVRIGTQPPVHSPTPSPYRPVNVRFTAPSRKLKLRLLKLNLNPLQKRILLIAGVAMGVIVLSMLASIIAVRWFAPEPKVAPQVSTPVVPPSPTGPIVTPVVPQQPLPATLEAEGLTHLTSPIEGVVRRAVIEGAAVKSGVPLVETGQISPDVERKRAKLAELEAKYGRSPDYADFIAQARDEYEKAARKSNRSALTAPHAGIVTRQRARVGDSVHKGDDLIELASRVRLIVATGSVEGNASACKATLLDRGDAIVIGHMLPFPPAARVRTLLVDRLPPGLPLGAVGKVRVTCQ
jgi:biotin carboxyl carrier protein